LADGRGRGDGRRRPLVGADVGGCAERPLFAIDVEFPARYGGNIRVFAGKTAATDNTVAAQEVDAAEARFGDSFATLSQGVTRWRDKKGAELQALVRQNGPLRGKAFPGRAAILAHHASSRSHGCSRTAASGVSVK